MITTKIAVPIPIYKGNVVVIQADDVEDVGKEYNLLTTKDVDAGFFYDDDYYYLFFSKKTCTPGIIAHECLHFVDKMFEDRSIKMDVSNDEPQCYLLGWIVDKCHSLLELSK